MEAIPCELLFCRDDDGREYFTEWFLNDLDVVMRGQVRAWLDRLEDGNFRNVESVGGGVSELKLDFGPCFRVYFGQKGITVHLILRGPEFMW